MCRKQEGSRSLRRSNRQTANHPTLRASIAVKGTENAFHLSASHGWPCRKQRRLRVQPVDGAGNPVSALRGADGSRPWTSQ
jgi:hypothetical protein